jgi:hypothetical protein
MRRQATVVAGTIVTFAVSTSAAFAVWTHVTQASAVTATMQSLSTPVLAAPAAATQNTASVPVSWSQAKTTDGTAATSYNVTRNKIVNGAVASSTTAAGSCGSSVTGLSCTDVISTDGRYSYTVKAIYKSWTKSATVTSGAVLVDMTKPVVTLASPATPTNVKRPTLSGLAGTNSASDTAAADGATVTVALTGPTSGAGGTATVNPSTGAWSFTPSVNLADGSYSVSVSQSDGAGNASTAATGGFAVDTVVPTVTVNQASAQPDPSSSGPINFTVTFSELVTGFNSSAVTIGGTATGTKTATVTGTGPTYTVAISGMTASGTVTASIPAGAVIDAAGNPNAASTSADNTVTFQASAAPVAPTGLAISNDGSNKITATWTTVAGLTYECVITAQGVAAPTSGYASCASGNQFTGQNGSHTFWLRAINASNQRSAPAQSNFTA